MLSEVDDRTTVRRGDCLPGTYRTPYHCIPVQTSLSYSLITAHLFQQLRPYRKPAENLPFACHETLGSYWRTVRQILGENLRKKPSLTACHTEMLNSAAKCVCSTFRKWVTCEFLKLSNCRQEEIKLRLGFVNLPVTPPTYKSPRICANYMSGHCRSGVGATAPFALY